MMESLPELTNLEVVLRISLAGFLGALVGFEREYSGQPAGFRTHILVSIGSALFTMTGAYGVASLVEGDTAPFRYDPTRIAAQVVAGIGFLGAGAILRHGASIRGLTTAAALWVTAAIGTAVGLGYWVAAVTAVAITVISLFFFKLLKPMIFGPRGSFRGETEEDDVERE